MGMTAHHEAGHIVIAAQCGIGLRADGIMLDREAAGLACYCKEPEDSDASREKVILSTFGGHMAEHRFCKKHSYPLRAYFEIIFSPDWKEARGIITKLSGEYCAGRGRDAVQKALENQSESAVEQNWGIIERVAGALLARNWEPVKPLKSGTQWSQQSEAKYLIGEEVAAILSKCGIVAQLSEC